MKPTLPIEQWLDPRRPDNTLIAWQGERVWTLGALRADVATLAARLRAQQGQRWALCLEDSYLFLVGLLATLHAGKTPVMPGHCRPALLAEQRALFDGLLAPIALVENSTWLPVYSGMGKEQPEPLVGHIDPACAVELFTSGSTGQPRCVSKPLYCLNREAQLLAARFGQQLGDSRVVASVPPMHLYGLTFRIFLPMSTGLALHAPLIRFPEQLTELAQGQRYLFISSPAFLKRLDQQLAAPDISLVFSAGGELPAPAADACAAWCGRWPQEIYGSTETGVVASRERRSPQPSWQLLEGVTLQAEQGAYRALSPLIADPAGLVLDDMLTLEPDGRFHLQGRRGREVKIEEKRISLSEVEQRLLALEGIQEAAVVPLERAGRQCLGAILVIDPALALAWAAQRQALERQWRAALRPWLEPVALPRHWRVVSEMPVNSMNKRITADLQELF